MCFIIIGQTFAEFVTDKMDEWNLQLANRQDLSIEIDSQILSVIQMSSQISTTAGNFVHFLKMGSKVGEQVLNYLRPRNAGESACGPRRQRIQDSRA